MLLAKNFQLKSFKPMGNLIEVLEINKRPHKKTLIRTFDSKLRKPN